MKLKIISVILFISIGQFCSAQADDNSGVRILFHGIVLDAKTFAPISNSQILVNHNFTSVSNNNGTFDFFVNTSDTVVFKHIGYKSTEFQVSDTLIGKEFAAGIYMKSDTVSIGEVVIVPRFTNLRSQIMNSPSKEPATMNNARYNVAISGYAGRTTTGKLGDPSTNYGMIRQQQKVNAFEKGGIPSDQITGINPLLIIPAAYLLMHGLPEKPDVFEKRITDQELKQIQQEYLDRHK
jgi:hypothetical protein